MGWAAKRAFKYRFYPTLEQAEQLNCTFGCVRKVYNLALDARTKAWTVDRRSTTYEQTSAMLTEWKRTDELAYLNDVSSVPLQQALRHLRVGFAAFFAKRARYPRFKSKRRSKASAEYTRPAFRWYVSILAEDPAVQPLPATSTAVGVDAGLTALVTLSTGEKVANPKHERADRRKLAKAQRDFLHKLSTRLVRENHTVVIEDLAVRNMVRNHSLARAISDLARAISDAAWSQLRHMLTYKVDWYGRTLAVVDRWYPSSKLCSACGRLAESTPLHVRAWPCQCGARHDRDVNAAVNILAAGLAER